MSSFNKVILLGRLTRDPELRVTPNGNNICKFSIATSRKFKLADGSLKEDVVFIEIDAFGRQAEAIAKFCSKGRQIFIEGRLKLDQWESQTGEKRSKVSVVLENFQFIGAREDSSDFSEPSNYDSASPPARAAVSAAPRASVSEDSFDDDVPF